MRKSLVVFLLAFVLASLTAPVMADIIPPIGLAPGTHYQLIFVTADGTPATSTAIGDYNTFATSEAALNPSLPSATWTVVGSTATVNALTNAPNLIMGGSYLPVYNTAGIEVSSGGLYSGSPPNVILSAVLYDQYGDSDRVTATWTGSFHAGTGAATNTLGTAVPAYGYDYSRLTAWLFAGAEYASSTSLPVYALSSMLTVPTPEPSTQVLLGSAFLLVGGMRFLQRRRAVVSTRLA